MEKTVEVIYQKTNKKLSNTSIDRAERMVKKKKGEWLVEGEKILLHQSYKDVKKLKAEFLDDKERICYLCGESIKEDEVSVDHIIAKANFGQDIKKNYAIAHKVCNSIKGKFSIKEVIEKKLIDISDKRAKKLIKKEKSLIEQLKNE